MAAHGVDNGAPASQHGYWAGRRREGAMLAQRAVTWRLRQLGIPHLDDLADLTNAFMCPPTEWLEKASIDILIPARTPQADAESRTLVRERLRNTVVFFPTRNGWVTCTCSSGDLTGKAEAPRVFARAFFH